MAKKKHQLNEKKQAREDKKETASSSSHSKPQNKQTLVIKEEEDIEDNEKQEQTEISESSSFSRTSENVSDVVSNVINNSVPDKSKDINDNSKKIRQRQENSLGELTKNFIRYIKENGNNIVHINDVVKKLKVKKRRIYDITNVLEGKNFFLGIGYIQKLEKNKVRWMKEDLNEDHDHWEQEKSIQNSIEEKTIKLEDLKKEEQRLDNIIYDLKNEFDNMLQEDDFKKYGYITHSDLKNLTSQEKNINLIAIKAPVGTTIEIPDPNIMENIYRETKNNMELGKEPKDLFLLESLQKKYQVFLECPPNSDSEIDIFLVLDREENKVGTINGGGNTFEKGASINQINLNHNDQINFNGVNQKIESSGGGLFASNKNSNLNISSLKPLK